jgi:transaldolase
MDAHIAEIRAIGQSIWLDNLSRALVRSGELERLCDLGVTGITSNPTIFQKAVSASADYDDAIRALRVSGRSAADILWDLMIEDVVAAADVLGPVHERSGGHDGFVSIEVSPAAAHSTEQTLEMARDLRRRCNRTNVMVKIPATPQGVPAIRQMIAEGANINVTLVFAVQRYEEVVEAFLSGLEEFGRNGGALDSVNSVASFFVSRVDTAVDAIIDGKLAGDLDDATRTDLASVRGATGIANSKLAYERYRALHSGPRWDALAKAGARTQRCLWASTSVKDLRYSDTKYVDNLIGASTVDTVPNATLEALVDHATVRETLSDDVDEARSTVARLAACHISLEEVTDRLEAEGVAAFEKSYRDLLAALTEASQAVTGTPGAPGAAGQAGHPTP